MTARDFRILITDRNPHVRDLLKREFAGRFVQVDTAGDGEEIMRRLASPTPPHLVILDPETPSGLGDGLVDALFRRGPDIPVILHGFGMEEGENGGGPGTVAGRVEKNGDTVRLLDEAERVLRQRYPARFPSGEAREREEGDERPARG